MCLTTVVSCTAEQALTLEFVGHLCGVTWVHVVGDIPFCRLKDVSNRWVYIGPMRYILQSSTRHNFCSVPIPPNPSLFSSHCFARYLSSLSRPCVGCLQGVCGPPVSYLCYVCAALAYPFVFVWFLSHRWVFPVSFSQGVCYAAYPLTYVIIWPPVLV